MFDLSLTDISDICIMAETLIIPGKHLSKAEQYQQLLPQLSALVAGEKNAVANAANIAAAIKEALGHFWVGFYFVDGNELVLGPFQGPIACTRIAKGKGVCGTAWAEAQTIVVPDVEAFPGHIACSALSKSEIVVPILYQSTVLGVLDIDSDSLNSFDETDAMYLQHVVELLIPSLTVR